MATSLMDIVTSVAMAALTVHPYNCLIVSSELLEYSEHNTLDILYTCMYTVQPVILFIILIIILSSS